VYERFVCVYLKHFHKFLTVLCLNALRYALRPEAHVWPVLVDKFK